MRFLKQSTGVTITMGPALDKTDGVTPETALSPTVYVGKNGGAQAARDSVSAISHDRDGYYLVPLSTTDTGTLGRLLVQFTDAATHLPVWEWFMVLPANVYDSLVGGTAALAVDAVAISGDTTAADNAESFFDGTGYPGTNNVIPTVTTTGTVNALANNSVNAAALATDAVTEIQSGLATSAALTTVAGYIDTEVAAIKAKTDNLPASPAAVGDIPTVAQIWAYVIEGSLSAVQVMRTLLSVLAGKSTGGGTTSVAFRDQADSKSRVTATVDEDGNRTAISLDPS